MTIGLNFVMTIRLVPIILLCLALAAMNPSTDRATTDDIPQYSIHDGTLDIFHEHNAVHIDNDTIANEILISSSSLSLPQQIDPYDQEFLCSLNTYYDIPLSNQEQDEIRSISEFYNIDFYLVLQMMKVESGYDRYADSGVCAGILQVHKYYAPYYTEWGDKYDEVFSKGYNAYNIEHNTIVALRSFTEWIEVTESRGYYGIKYALECMNRGYTFFHNPSNLRYSTIVLRQDIEIADIN